jgi:hypothetical protein
MCRGVCSSLSLWKLFSFSVFCVLFVVGIRRWLASCRRGWSASSSCGGVRMRLWGGSDGFLVVDAVEAGASCC